VTFRIAARFADELNLSQLPKEKIEALLPIIRQRCEEIDRDPATLRVSTYLSDEPIRRRGQERVDLLGEMANLGLARVMAFPARWGDDPELQASFAEDCRTAGFLS
jgi:alkanesulfonate monooxygenase SsuD/methylene tetrahydromethanopterin reductase-like flavin-dependent oxidoreductase (luciferase family)